MQLTLPTASTHRPAGARRSCSSERCRPPPRPQRRPSGAAPFSYVALGDSFSSGEGVAPFLQSGPACHRSSRAYSTWVRPPGYAKPLYAIASGALPRRSGGGANLYGSGRRTCARRRASRGPPGRARARRRRTSCREPRRRAAGSGAATTARRRSTAPSLARADLVTLTIGGNDAGYVDVLVTCGLGNCNTRAFERSRAAIIDRTKPRLEKVYRAIAAEGAARPHPRPRLSAAVPGREGTAGVPRAEPLPGRAGHAAAARRSPQRHDRVGRRHGRPLGRAASRSSPWRAGSRATRSVAARARGSTGSSQLDRLRARPGVVPPDARRPAGRVRGCGQRRAAALTAPATSGRAARAPGPRCPRRSRRPAGRRRACRSTARHRCVRRRSPVPRAPRMNSSRGSVPAPSSSSCPVQRAPNALRIARAPNSAGQPLSCSRS